MKVAEYELYENKSSGVVNIPEVGIFMLPWQQRYINNDQIVKSKLLKKRISDGALVKVNRSNVENRQIENTLTVVEKPVQISTLPPQTIIETKIIQKDSDESLVYLKNILEEIKLLNRNLNNTPAQTFYVSDKVTTASSLKPVVRDEIYVPMFGNSTGAINIKTKENVSENTTEDSANLLKMMRKNK